MMKTSYPEELISIIGGKTEINNILPHHVKKAEHIIPVLKDLYFIHRITKKIIRFENKVGFRNDAKKKIADIFGKFLDKEDIFKKHNNILLDWYIDKVYSDANDLYVGFTLSTDQEFNDDIKEFEKILNDKKTA